MKRRIGLAALTVLELPAPEQVSVASAAGYDCVGLRLLPLAGQVLPSYDQQELERRLADTGLRVLDVEVFRLEAGTQVAAFEPVLALAQRLGASEILVHGADADETRLAQTFGALCELAGRHGLACNIEPMPWVHISNVSMTKRILDAAAAENSALLVDPIHFFRSDSSLEELMKIPASKLRYLQFCDARAERPADMQELIRQARGDRLMPGEGGLDLRALLKALPDDLPLCLEIPYAKPMGALERAKLALRTTRTLLDS